MDTTMMAAVAAGAVVIAVLGWWLATRGGSSRAAPAAGGRLSKEEIVRRLEGQGYQVEEVEFDDGRYEVEAIDRDGDEVDLVVDPVSGAILKAEKD